MSRETIGSLAKQVRGVAYAPEDLHKELDGDSIVLLRANNIDNGKINFDDVVFVDKRRVSPAQILQKGDILVCTSSGSKNLVGKAASFDFPTTATFGAFCKVVRPQNSEDADYLALFFQSPFYRREISAASMGANINNIRNEHIDSLPIRWPEAKTRRKAVEILKTAGNVLRKRREELQQLDELVKARFVEMFGNPLADNENTQRISSCGKIYTGNTPPMREASYYESRDIPFVKPGNLAEHGVTRIENVEEFVSEKARGVARIMPPGAVLVTCIGTIGKVGIATRECCCNQQINFILPDANVDSLYLAYCLTFFVEKMKDMANAPVVPILNKTQFSSLEIPVPAQAMQKQFADFVAHTELVRATVERALGEAQVLFDSLMQESFGF